MRSSGLAHGLFARQFARPIDRERAGLVVTQKVGRVRTCKLGKRGLKAEAEWIEAHRKLFEARFEALDEIISEMKQEGSDESTS